MPVIEALGPIACNRFWMLVGTAGQRYHRRPAEPLGSMPGTELLSAEGPLVKKQIRYARAAHRRTETQPDR